MADKDKTDPGGTKSVFYMNPTGDTTGSAANRGNRVPRGGTKAGRFKRFLDKNKDNVALSSGVATGNDWHNVCVYFTQEEAFSDLGDADYEEFSKELLFVIVVTGGAERAYVPGRKYEVSVGGKDREVELAQVVLAAKSVRQTVRGLARAKAFEVEKLLVDSDFTELLRQNAGEEDNVYASRGDLFPKGYQFKFEKLRLAMLRREKLENAEEPDGND